MEEDREDGSQSLRRLEEQLRQLRGQSAAVRVDVSVEIEAIEAKVRAMRQEIYANLGIWERVQLARHPGRPYSLDYIGHIFSDFEEIHGDRLFGDDPSIVCGLAALDGRPIVVIGQQKGRNVKENIFRNFGCPQPEGYHKALRAMRLANKFSLAIVTFIDTPGAYPGIGSEERHVGGAIATNLLEMSTLRVPSVGVVIGEGGSGGALGIAVVDRLLLLENAYFSVISPEGCASILWKDGTKAPEAARALQLNPHKLLEFGIVDEILAEPLGGAHQDPMAAVATVKDALLRHLAELGAVGDPTRRQARYRSIGVPS
ncbi:MAG: acetyl-CoA carboxylase carboxyltransferase subunit alpha [Puniceicoccales bacterium]|nr:acetyl-CoA carboxylase carboxyltransferase subunit alpha [Puniceicoccales bacterium]